MKFKREDIGLYFALGLAVGGFGLLLGALIAARMNRRQKEEEWSQSEIDFEAQQEADERFDEGIEMAGQVIDSMEEEEVVKPRKKSKKGFRDSPELVAFIDEWNPNPVQLTMLREGVLTMEEVQDAIAGEKASQELEPTDYGKVYRSDYDEDKPDLGDLVEELVSPDDEDVIGERWVLSEGIPEDKDAKGCKVVYWDENDNAFYRMTRTKNPVPLSITKVMSQEAWDTVLVYFELGWDTIFVDDLRSPTKYIRLEKVAADLEDSADTNDTS